MKELTRLIFVKASVKDVFFRHIFFSIYTEQIMRESNTEDYGISIGGRKVSNLRYADDTALCANNHQDICTLLNNINEKGKRTNMKINAKKKSLAYWQR